MYNLLNNDKVLQVVSGLSGKGFLLSLKFIWDQSGNIKQFI